MRLVRNGCESVGRKAENWKGSATRRELEPGNKGIAVVGAVIRKLLLKILWSGKDLA
jgi:hypothetical protein